MSKKGILRKIAGSLLLVSVVAGGYMGKAYAEASAPMSEGGEASYSEEPGANSRSNVVYWVYREENGYVLMALYDATDQKWLTPWLICPSSVKQ